MDNQGAISFSQATHNLYVTGIGWLTKIAQALLMIEFFICR